MAQDEQKWAWKAPPARCLMFVRPAPQGVLRRYYSSNYRTWITAPKLPQPKLPHLNYRTWITTPELPRLNYRIWITAPELPHLNYRIWITAPELPHLNYCTRITAPELPHLTCCNGFSAVSLEVAAAACNYVARNLNLIIVFYFVVDISPNFLF